VGLQYSQDIVEDLKWLRDGNSVEKILKRPKEKSHGKGYQSAKESFDRSLLSPKDYGRDSYGSIYKKNEMNSTDTLGNKTHDVIVEAIFPVKLLLRITSKKNDAKFLSFYFKLPTMEKLNAMNVSKYFNFTEQNIQELPYLMKKDEYLRVLKEISEMKEPEVKFP